jgi:molybdate-binding protein
MAIANPGRNVIRGKDMVLNLRLGVGVKIANEEVDFVRRKDILMGKEVKEFFSAICMGADVHSGDVQGSGEVG